MKNSWGFILSAGVAAVFALTNLSYGLASDTGCVACHGDAKKLQEIVAKLPKKEKSAETAGTG